MLGKLLAYQVQGQPGGPDPPGTLEQGRWLHRRDELRPAREDGLDTGQSCTDGRRGRRCRPRALRKPGWRRDHAI